MTVKCIIYLLVLLHKERPPTHKGKNKLIDIIQKWEEEEESISKYVYRKLYPTAYQMSMKYVLPQE